MTLDLERQRPDQHTSDRLHILMITEGTYPYHWGGVSTWCHLLLSDLPDIDFTLVSIIGDPSTKPRFELPKNVVEFRPISLWGVRELLESRTELGLRELISRKMHTNESAIEEEFIPLFRSFLEEIFAYSGNAHYVAVLIHRMYRFFMDYDFDTAMRSQAAWQCLVEVAQTEYPKAAKLNGYDNVRYSLADLTSAMQWLYHWLFVIGEPLPKTDVAHAAMAGICTMVAVVCKLEHGTPYMLTEHGIYLRERYLAESRSAPTLFRKLFSLRFSRLMTLLSYALADQIAPCCDYNQRWELRHGAKPEQIHTIYYGVDSVQFTPEHKTFGDPPVVVWVGRIDPLKDLLTLLRAAHLVHKVRPDIEFRLYGGATPGTEAYHAQCLALHKELELEDVVIFGGFRSNPVSAFNEADVVILTSVSEAFPFVVLEAMLCEKPVVATAVGGVPEQVDGCGIAVEPRNPEAMAEAILKLMGDADLCNRLGLAAREKAVQQYSVRQSGLMHESVYRKLCRNATGAATAASTGNGATAQETVSNSSNGHQKARILLSNNGRSQQNSVIVARNGKHGSASRADSIAVLERPTTTVVKLSGNGLTGNGSRSSKEPTANGTRAANGDGTANRNGTTNSNGTASADVYVGTGSNGNGLSKSDGAKTSPTNGKQAWSQSEYTTSHVNNAANVRTRSKQPYRNGNGNWESEHADAIDLLAYEAVQQTASPIDSLEVTALLESMGITDDVARQRYGAPDAFDLGYVVYSRLRRENSSLYPNDDVYKPGIAGWEAIRQYLKGPLGLIPPFMLLLMLLVASRSGLFSPGQVLVFSAGVTGSLLVSNGLVQGIGRRTAIYLSMRKPRMAARYLAVATIGTTAVIVFIATLLTAWLILYRHYAAQPLITFLLSFVGFTVIWMSAGGLSLVEGAHWLSIGLAAGLIIGTTATYLIFTHSMLPPAFGLLAGYLVTVLVIVVALYRRYTKADGDHSPSSDYQFPSLPYALLEGMPYFTYGALYMALIMMPHFLAWRGALHPGQISPWRITSTEIGLTLSMPPIILAYGVTEYALRLFWRVAAVAQTDTSGARVPGFGQQLLQFAARKRTIYMITLGAISLLTYCLFHASVDAGLIERWLHIADASALLFIFDASLVAYALLGIGLYNCMFAVTLSSPNAAVFALMCALATLFIAGVWFGAYYFAYVAIAFVISAAVFALLSWCETARVIRSADFSFASTI